MSSIKEQLIKWLYREVLASSVVNFEDVLRNTFIAGLQYQPLNADLATAKGLTRYYNDIKKAIDIDKEHYRSPVFHVQDDNLKRVLWHPQHLIDSGQVTLGQALKIRPNILQAIDAMDDRQYEALACVVCNLLGASDTYLTPPGNEGGVDFYAVVNMSSDSHIFGALNKGMRIVGQTKKYDSKETITSFNSFITTLNNVRVIHRSVSDHIPSWFSRGKGPIIGWYIASNGFQSGVVSTSQEHGIILSDSIDLAEVIAVKLLPVAGTTPTQKITELNSLVAAKIANP